MTEIELLQYQIDATKLVTEALLGKAPLAKSAQEYAIEYILRCNVADLVPLLTAMIEVVSAEFGCATKLEDVRDELREK